MGIFYELARQPHNAERIYEEVKDIDVNDVKHLTSLDHLNGVISEALRLHPVLPTGGNGKTLEHGVTIGGRYIPPYTAIVAPQYCISRRRYHLAWREHEADPPRGGLFYGSRQICS